MKNIFLSFFCFASALTASVREGYMIEKDVAQYGGSDYANVVHVARGISLEQAFEIAESNPEIDYFVYLKGGQMVLEFPSGASFHPSQDPFGLVSRYDQGYYRIFRHGDTVFFKKEGLWLGSAVGFADTYFKK